jgi:hypothetical protein
MRWKYPSDKHYDSPNESIPSPTSDTSLDFWIMVANIYSLDTSVYIPHSSDSNLPSEALALRGYIRNAPLSLSNAISIRMLELY